MKGLKTCSNCDEEFDHSMSSSGYSRDDKPLCDYCYSQVTEICACCEECFFSPESPEETRLVVAPEESEYAQPGIYQVLEFPYKYDNIISGFEGFFNNTIKRVADAPKNRYGEDYPSGLICPDCFAKHTRTIRKKL